MNMEDAGRRPALRRATGRDYEEWFALLDEWGAPGRGFREISDWLIGEHGFTKWWAQKVIVEYEQARGLRPAGVRPDGTFTVGVSKTVAVGLQRLYDAFHDPDIRERWLPGVELRERGGQAGRSARFDWTDGSRLSVGFTALGETKAQVSVEHERLPDAGSAEERKAYWRDRLTALKRLLED